jgi:hypothetical protein
MLKHDTLSIHNNLNTLKKYRFASFPSENLSILLNPSIAKLVKEKEKAKMYRLGPFYT